MGIAPPHPRSKRPGAGGASDEARSGFGARTLHRVLGNGLTLDVMQNRAVPTVAVQGIVFAGRMEAPAGHPAVPELTAMMLSRGTRTKDKREIAALLDGAGAQLRVSAFVTEATITGNGLARDLRMLLATLADELKNPAFSDSEIVKAKLEMRANVLRNSESTSARGFDRLTRLAYPEGHPYRAPTTEAMLASLDRATAADLRAFWRERYVGAGTILAIVGDVDPEGTAALVDSSSALSPAGRAPSTTARPRPPTCPSASWRR